MEFQLNGSTRLYFVVGHPVQQVKSPEGVSQALIKHGLNAIVTAADVQPKYFPHFVQSTQQTLNVDGLIITVPHKITALACCEQVTDRAKFIGAVNTIRRCEAGWDGDMLDGKGMLEAILDKQISVKNKRVILAGAGGAGKAIAYEMILAGVAELAIYELDSTRQQQLVQHLSQLNLAKVVAHNNDPTGFDLLINATPMGMNQDTQSAFLLEKITTNMAVADVVTQPENTVLIQRALSEGCKVVRGTEMFEKVRDLMVSFLLQKQGVHHAA